MQDILLLQHNLEFIKEDILMNEISVLDLQNLRHLIGGYETSHCKMKQYASQCNDAKVKQFFEKSAQSAMQTKQQLMQFL